MKKVLLHIFYIDRFTPAEAVWFSVFVMSNSLIGMGIGFIGFVASVFIGEAVNRWGDK